MSHPTEEDLILHHYREADAPEAVAAHIASCEACSAEYDALRRTLDAVAAGEIPERGEGYGERVWRRLQPRLEERPSRMRRFLVPAALAASLLVAFLLGRLTVPPGPRTAGPSREAVRERILLVAVGDHLERSRMVLVELMNADGQGPVDISSEQQWAEALVANNKIYRQTAARAGETAVESVLDDLERVLIEVAQGPTRLSAGQLSEIRRRIESQGLLLKVRVIGSQVREREKGMVGGGGTAS